MPNNKKPMPHLPAILPARSKCACSARCAHRIVRPDTDKLLVLAATTCAIEKFLSTVMTVPWRCTVSAQVADCSRSINK